MCINEHSSLKDVSITARQAAAVSTALTSQTAMPSRRSGMLGGEHDVGVASIEVGHIFAVFQSGRPGHNVSIQRLGEDGLHCVREHIRPSSHRKKYQK